MFWFVFITVRGVLKGLTRLKRLYPRLGEKLHLEIVWVESIFLAFFVFSTNVRHPFFAAVRVVRAIRTYVLQELEWSPLIPTKLFTEQIRTRILVYVYTWYVYNNKYDTLSLIHI